MIVANNPKGGKFKTRYLEWLLLVVSVIVFGLVGCSGTSKPNIRFNPVAEPLVAGQEFAFHSVSVDNKGIARVEFAADNVLVAESKVNPPQKEMTLPHLWKAEVGQHTLSVRAFNVDNLASELVSMVVVVAPTPVPPADATPTRIPVPATHTPAPGACTRNAAFVKDITVPDGTPWKPNQQFNKIWQIQNTGTCTWTPKYALAWVSGEPMSTVQSIALSGNVAPGQLVDVLVPMTAPAAPGAHVGKWQLRDENNSLFGTVLTASIVTLPAPPQAAVTSPGNAFQFAAGSVVRVTFGGSANTELSSVSLYANGALLMKQAPRSPSRGLSLVYDGQPAAGNYDLYAVVVDIDGQQTTSAHVAGAITPPHARHRSISVPTARRSIAASIRRCVGMSIAHALYYSTVRVSADTIRAILRQTPRRPLRCA